VTVGTGCIRCLASCLSHGDIPPQDGTVTSGAVSPCIAETMRAEIEHRSNSTIAAAVARYIDSAAGRRGRV